MMFIGTRVQGKPAVIAGLLLALVLGVAGIGHGATAASTGTGSDAGREQPPPTLDELKNATFTGIDVNPVKLVNGMYEGPPYVPGGASRQRIELLDFQPVTGDLNDDGINESVVLLNEDNGGTGTFLYLAVVERSQGKIVTIGTTRVGDRLGVRSLRVSKGQIILELLQHGPKDAACCPSELATRIWTLERTGLVERAIKKKPVALSLKSLEGVEWLFRGFKGAPDNPPLTLVFEKDRISGSAGCNNYQGAAVTTKQPGMITLTVSKATNRECGTKAMIDEERYLTALRRVVKYGFFLGDLIFAWQKEDGSTATMRFAPGKPPAK